jgi:hypothetical protein
MKFTTHLELHSQTTRLVEGVSHRPCRRLQTGFSPSLTFCSKKFKPGPYPKHPLQITTRTPKRPDFKFELLPLHSPLLRQSLLVSFPPLIDMLKFSGYSYLIRGQPEKVRETSAGALAAQRLNGRLESFNHVRARKLSVRGSNRRRHYLWDRSRVTGTWSNNKPGLRGDNDARTGMPFGIPKGAICVQRFDDSRILQFALLIAFRCVLHRCQNQEIRC